MDSIKRIIKTLIGLSSMLIGATFLVGSFVAVPLSLIIMPLGLSIMYPSIKLTQEGIYGNYIKNSCFIVVKNKKLKRNDKERIDVIGQDLFAFKEMIASRKDSNKQRFFALEAIKCFEQLKKYHHNEPIKYGVASQIYTVMLLKKMQRLGYVNILSNEKTDRKTNLFIERVTLGLKARKRKVTIYNVVFTLTDKKFDSFAIDEIIRSFGIDISNYNRTYNKKGYSIFKINKKIKDVPPNELTELDMTKEDYNLNSISIDSNKKYKLYRIFPFLQKRERDIKKNEQISELKKIREELINSESNFTVDDITVRPSK